MPRMSHQAQLQNALERLSELEQQLQILMTAPEEEQETPVSQEFVVEFVGEEGENAGS